MEKSTASSKKSKSPKELESEKEAKYQSAVKRMNSNNAVEVMIAISAFDELGDYKDSIDYWKKAKFYLRILAPNVVQKWKESEYQDALRFMQDQDSLISMRKAKIILASLSGYKDADALYDKVIQNMDPENIYLKATKLAEKSNRISDLSEAVKLLEALEGYKDSEELIQKYKNKISNLRNGKKYREAIKLAEKEEVSDLKEAIAKLENIIDYKDSTERVITLRAKVHDLEEKEKQKRLEEERISNYEEAIKQARTRIHDQEEERNLNESKRKQEEKEKKQAELKNQIIKELREAIKTPESALKEARTKLSYRRNIRSTMNLAFEVANENMITNLKQKVTDLENDPYYKWLQEMLNKYAKK